MPYRALPNHLHGTADATKRFFSTQFGLNRLKVEIAVDPRIGYAPTFWGTSSDHHLVCIDVAVSLSSATRHYFVSECEKLGLPVKMYVVLPTGTDYREYMSDAKRAKRTGVGVIEVDPTTGNGVIVHQALSLSVTGLRAFDKKGYPPRLRGAIMNAEETFKNGDPNKACSNMYDEVEDLSRKIALKCEKKGLLRQSIGSRDQVMTKPWARLMQDVGDHLKRSNAVVKSADLCSRIAAVQGITSHRNQSGHNPSTTRKRAHRDLRLRTRMETAVDLLLDLVLAARGIGLRP